jgi:hypothetical protein
MPDIPDETYPARRQGWVRRNLPILGFGLIVLTGGLVIMYGFIANQRALTLAHEHQAKLRALGEPTTLSELKPSVIPDGDNFAHTPLIQGIVHQRFDRDVPAVAAQLARASSLVGHQPKLEGIIRGARVSGPSPIEEVMSALAPLEPELARLRSEARVRTKSQILLNWNADPISASYGYLSQLRSLSQLLHMHALASLASGHAATAHDDALVLHRIMAGIGEDRGLIPSVFANVMSGMLLNVYEQGVQSGKWSAEQHESFQQMFSSVNYPAMFLRALRAERLTTRHGAMTMLSGAPTSTDLIGRLQQLLPKGLIEDALTEHSEAFQNLSTVGFERNPVRYDPVALRRFTEGMKALGESSNPMKRTLGHDFEKTVHSMATRVAQVHGAVQGAAIERYRAAHGQYPGDLSALVPRFLDALPPDPFTGKPYVYRRANHGYVLYSVGLDGVDDGGTADAKNTGAAGSDLPFAPREPTSDNRGNR